MADGVEPPPMDEEEERKSDDELFPETKKVHLEVTHTLKYALANLFKDKI